MLKTRTASSAIDRRDKSFSLMELAKHAQLSLMLVHSNTSAFLTYARKIRFSLEMLMRVTLQWQVKDHGARIAMTTSLQMRREQSARNQLVEHARLPPSKVPVKFAQSTTVLMS